MLPRMSANPVPESPKNEATKHEDTKPAELADILERMKKAQLEAGAPSYEKRVERLVATYAELPADGVGALFGSTDTLELAAPSASAANRLGLGRGATVTVTRA